VDVQGSGTRSEPPRTKATGTTTTTTTTTTPTTPTTTTTTTPHGTTPEADSGWFLHGSTEARRELGPVDFVSVDVSADVAVTLTVFCGLLHETSTSVSAASVTMPDGPAPCTATIEVPSSTLEPASWRLVAR
jgi:hypothetical protein